MDIYIYIAPSRETSKGLRHGSHSVIYLQLQRIRGFFTTMRYIN